jgi:hypothetical protein
MTEDVFLAQILGHKLLPGAAACVVGLSGRNNGNAKQIGASLDMIESMTGRSRPDFRAVALLRTAHRSFILQRGQVKRGTSEPRKLHWPFMQRSSKGSSQEEFQ